MLLASADRTIFAAAALSLKAELGMSMKDLALAQSAFLWGYGVTQLAAGASSDRFGGAKVLLGGLCVWSIAVAVTPLSSMTTAPVLAVVAARFLFGAASGCALPASAAAVAAHVPAERRSGALSTIFALFNIGSAFGLAAAGSLITQFGWRAIFYGFGAFGAAWAVAAYAARRRADRRARAAPPQPHARRLLHRRLHRERRPLATLRDATKTRNAARVDRRRGRGRERRRV